MSNRVYVEYVHFENISASGSILTSGYTLSIQDDYEEKTIDCLDSWEELVNRYPLKEIVRELMSSDFYTSAEDDGFVFGGQWISWDQIEPIISEIEKEEKSNET